MYNSFRMHSEKQFAIKKIMLFFVPAFLILSCINDNVVISEKVVPIKTETKAVRKHTKSFLTENDIKKNAISSLQKVKMLLNLLKKKNISKKAVRMRDINKFSKMYLKAKNKLENGKYLSSLMITLKVRQRFLKFSVNKTSGTSKRFLKRLEVTKQERSIMNNR